MTCFVGKIEQGQGVITSLPQLLAEELDVSLAAVDIVMGDTDLCPWDMGTFGSLSVRQFGPVLRQGAADARALLLQMAAERLQVPVERLAVKAGIVSDTRGPEEDGDLRAADGRQADRAQGGGQDPAEAAQVVHRGRDLGQAARRPREGDRRGEVRGRRRAWEHRRDACATRRCGVLHARILRPPSHGAMLGAVDISAAEKVPGVKVVRDGDMVAVLHAHRDEADKALALVRAEWTRKDPPVDDATMYDHFLKTAGPARNSGEGGNLAEGEKLVGQVIEGTYYDSYVAHAPMEPHSAVAAVENGKVTVWVGTQTPFPLKNQLMQALKLPADKVRVITPYVGGGFGGKIGLATGRGGGPAGDADRQAGSRGVQPRGGVLLRHLPTGLDREDPGGPRPGDEDDRPVGLQGLLRRRARRGALLQHPASPDRVDGRVERRLGRRCTRLRWARGARPGRAATRSAASRTSTCWRRRPGIDPVEFRLKNLTDERMIRTLNAAAKKFGWVPKPAPSRRGVGVALGVDAGTYAAVMAEVTVDRATGKVRVTRLVCAQDMGVVVNPEGAIQQMEGCLTMAPRLHAERRGALQGRRGAEPQPRQLRAAAVLVAAEDRDRDRGRPGRAVAGRRRAGAGAGGRGGGERDLRRDRRPADADADDGRTREGGAQGTGLPARPLREAAIYFTSVTLFRRTGSMS